MWDYPTFLFWKSQNVGQLAGLNLKWEIVGCFLFFFFFSNPEHYHEFNLATFAFIAKLNPLLN